MAATPKTATATLKRGDDSKNFHVFVSDKGRADPVLPNVYIAKAAGFDGVQEVEVTIKAKA